MGKIKNKGKYNRGPQLSANNIAARKRSKQDAVHRIVMTYLERKTRSDV